MLDFSNQLVADGWATVLPPLPGYLYQSTQAVGLQVAFAYDSGSGYMTTNLKWWDHVVDYVQANVSASCPIVVFGISLGGLVALQVATNRTSSIAAYASHVAAIKSWTINPGILDVGPGGFFGTADASTTVTAGSSGVSLPISGGVLDVVSTTGFGTGTEPAHNLVIVRGTGGWQIITYTGTTPTSFTGCTGGNTSNGTLETGDVVQHSKNTSAADIRFDALNALGPGQQGSTPPGWIGVETGDTFLGYSDQTVLANEAIAASQPVTLYTVNGGEHEFSATDVTAIMSWITGTVDPLCPAVY